MSESSRGVVTWLLWSQIVSGHGVTTCVVKCGVVGPSGVLHAGVSKGERRQWSKSTPKAVANNGLYYLLCCPHRCSPTRCFPPVFVPRPGFPL